MERETLITLPWVGLTNIEPIKPIVDTLAFQKTKRILQLGFSNIVYSNANSSRGTIMLVTWRITKRLTKKLVNKGCISPEVAHNINLTALLHDIGHGPSSHAIEVMTKIDHVQNGARILRNDEEMRRGIKRCGGDPDFIAACLEGQQPEFVIVDDKNLGTDKLVYLVMAHWDTDFGTNIARLVENIIYHLAYEDDQMKIDVKALNALMEIQHAYNYFYKDLFLSRPTQRVQRYMQKMIFHLLNKPSADGGFNEEELWDMTDEELKAKFITSPDPVIQFGYGVYRRGISAFPKTGLTVKLKGHGYIEQGGEEFKVIEADRDFFDKFYRSCDPANLEKMEAWIAKLLGIGSYAVIITNITSSDKSRFVPQDVKFFNSAVSGSDSLIENNKSHFDGLSSDLENYISVRVCAIPEYRYLIYDNAPKIFDLIKGYINK